uniref:Uncharacterized protein n=1 Tax=Anguilla anguilla TaxID=7936 RepID=A0A0E9QLI0_ANGAN
MKQRRRSRPFSPKVPSVS